MSLLIHANTIRYLRKKNLKDVPKSGALALQLTENGFSSASSTAKEATVAFTCRRLGASAGDAVPMSMNIIFINVSQNMQKMFLEKKSFLFQENSSNLKG